MSAALSIKMKRLSCSWCFYGPGSPDETIVEEKRFRSICILSTATSLRYLFQLTRIIGCVSACNIDMDEIYRKTDAIDNRQPTDPNPEFTVLNKANQRLPGLIAASECFVPGQSRRMLQYP